MKYVKICRRASVLIVAIIALVSFSIATVTSEQNSEENPPETKIITWDVLITYTSPDGSGDTTKFGEAPDANDGLPADSYDKPNPIAPPPPYVDAWFDDGLTSPYDTLWDDYRHYPDTSKVWNLTILWFHFSSSTTINLTWDPLDVNDSEYDSVLLHDFYADTTVANMLTDSYYAYSAAPFNISKFEIRCNIDDVKPEIIDNTVGPGETGDSFTFNATVTDNVGLGAVKVDWSHGGFSANDTMVNVGGDYYEKDITLDESTSDLSYTIYAEDTAKTPNTNTTSAALITVVDDENPVITGDSGNVAVTTGESVLLYVTATDNIGVTSAEVTIDAGAPQAMTLNAGQWEYTYNAPSGDDSDHTYTLEVFDDESLSDTSGPHDITVTDNDPPTITDVTATPASQIIDGYVNITATVTDNINVNIVKVNITGPAGFTPVNVTMNEGSYYYNENYSDIGLYNFTIWAEDSSSNSLTSAQYQFEIVSELQITNMSDEWNFVSLPFNQSVPKTNLFVIYLGSEYNWTEATTGGDPILLPFIYDFNRTSQSYEESQTLEPGRGYWLWAYYECELWATGLGKITPDNYITAMESDWNSFGVPADVTVNKADITIWYLGSEYNWTEATTGVDPILIGFVFGFNRTSQLYDEVDLLEPGRCYWIFAYYDCIMKW